MIPAIFPHLLLTSLHVENFRNIESATLTPAPGLNWLCGDNGAGKTSVLEAIHVLGDVEKGARHYGVAPVENSIEGAVNHALDRA